MKFGYFANQNNRRLEKSFRQVVEETRDLARYLDGQDWESIWFTEHHFGHEGYEVCPNPLMMSCDVAAHTDFLRSLSGKEKCEHPRLLFVGLDDRTALVGAARSATAMRHLRSTAMRAGALRATPLRREWLRCR